MPYRSFDSHDEDIKKLERKVKAHERRWKLVTMSFSIRDILHSITKLFHRFWESEASVAVSFFVVINGGLAAVLMPIARDQHKKEDCMVSCVEHHWRYNAHTRNACICAVNNHELAVIKDEE